MPDHGSREEWDAAMCSRLERLDCHARTREQFLEWQQEFRGALRQVLGLPDMDRMPRVAQPRCVEDVPCDGYRRQKWSIATEPDLHVPFYLLLPEGPAKPRPVVLALHGHGPGKVTPVGLQPATAEPGDGERDYAVQAVRQGYIALAPDLRGMGELRRPEDIEAGARSSCRTLQMHALFSGSCLIGQRVFDISRLIDWLLTRDDVDPARIVATGNSGGGTATLFAAACDTRIAAAVPSCYFCTFADSILAMWHCECNYIPGMLTLGEMWNVAGLIAPRPLLILAGAQDPIFPVAGVEHAYQRLEEIYRVAGASANLQKFVGPGGHRYYAEPVWPFFSRVFQPKK